MSSTAATSGATGMPPAIASNAPDKATLVLGSLIIVAAVANLNLSVANVALPDIGEAFDASQRLDLVAVGYSLGLAGSVLWLGALGDRYGRKLMLLLGMGLSIPASILAAPRRAMEVLVPRAHLRWRRRRHGLSDDPRAHHGPVVRARADALDRALVGAGGAIAALGPLVSGFLLEHFDWGSVFLVTLPLAVVALFLAWRFVPAHVNETTETVDNLGGILSVVVIVALILAINLAPVPGMGRSCSASLLIAVAAGVAFVLRQRRAPNPLYDLDDRGAPSSGWPRSPASSCSARSWARCSSGSSTCRTSRAIRPSRRARDHARAVLMVLVAPRSAKLVDARGARFTLLFGYVFVLLGFVTMLVLWDEGSPYWVIGLGYGLVGVGVGLAGTPASRSLTGSVPVRRAGMASGTADLQRDLGGAIMQSIFGALLTAGYAAAFARPSPPRRRPTRSHRASRTSSRCPTRARPTSRRAIRSTRTDHRGRESVVPRRGRLRLCGRHHRGHHRGRDRAHALPAPRRGICSWPDTTHRTPRTRQTSSRRCRPPSRSAVRLATARAPRARRLSVAAAVRDTSGGVAQW